MERKFELLPCVGLAERCPVVKRADKFAQEIEESANNLRQLKAEILLLIQRTKQCACAGDMGSVKDLLEQIDAKLSAV